MDSIQLYSFNERGLAEMGNWLSATRAGGSIRMPVEIADSKAMIIPVGKAVPAAIFSEQAFFSKLTLARALDEAIQYSGVDEFSQENDKGFWSWLAFRFAERLVQRGKKLGEDALWIYQPGDWRKCYRHKMAGIWEIYRAHRDNPERLQGLMSSAPTGTGEIFEQLASSKHMILSHGIMELVSRLYYAPDTGGQRKGGGGKGGGSARRLKVVLDQLGQTYDIEALDVNTLAGMLPGDFHKFLD